MLEIYHCLLPGGIFLGSTYTKPVAGLEAPRFSGCTRLLPRTTSFNILDFRLPVQGRTCRTGTY
jgi:hypothetical protein